MRMNVSQTIEYVGIASMVIAAVGLSLAVGIGAV